MDYLMEKIDECNRHLSEASKRKDLNMIIFWGNAVKGFIKRACFLLETSEIMNREPV